MPAEEEQDRPAFPRLETRLFPPKPSPKQSSADLDEDGGVQGQGDGSQVFLQVHQRKGKPSSNMTVRRTEDGGMEIPMSVAASAVGAHLPRDVLQRSPWLARALGSPEGAVLTRVLGADPDAPAQADGDSAYAVTCKRTTTDAIEIGIPSEGPGKRLLTPGGVVQMLEMASPGSSSELDVSGMQATTILGFFMWATVLEFSAIASVCRAALAASVDISTVALVLAAGHGTGDADLLKRCYWCLRELMCGATGVPGSWLDGKGPVKLVRGALLHADAVSTPLRILAGTLQEDLADKMLQWQVPTDCYTLCQVHRTRGPDGDYPHSYELRLDHSDEVIMRAIREDERGACRIYTKNVLDPGNASEHNEEYLGSVVPNFWGTSFVINDSGTDIEALGYRCKESTQLPLRRQTGICTVGYETNLLGDCPRKITVDFERGKTKHHMENLGPRWDAKLGSYALPFFGRVKKASAKNFQLVVNGDQNTIYLMFGKISKDVFCLDFRGPLAPLDAMGIAIAALAKKRAVS